MTSEVREEFDALRRVFRDGFERLFQKLEALEASLDRMLAERDDGPKEWVDGAPWYSHDPVSGKRIEPAFDTSLSGVIDKVVKEYQPGGVTRRTILAHCCESGYRYADAEATLVNLLGSGYLKVVEEDSYNHERDLIALGSEQPSTTRREGRIARQSRQSTTRRPRSRASTAPRPHPRTRMPQRQERPCGLTS